MDFVRASIDQQGYIKVLLVSNTIRYLYPEMSTVIRQSDGYWILSITRTYDDIHNQLLAAVFAVLYVKSWVDVEVWGANGWVTASKAVL